MSVIAYKVIVTSSFVISGSTAWALCYKEHINRKTISIEQQIANKNTYQQRMDKWSIMAMIFLTITLTIAPFHAIYTICKYSRIIGPCFYAQGKIWTTVYQISRYNLFFFILYEIICLSPLFKFINN